MNLHFPKVCRATRASQALIGVGFALIFFVFTPMAFAQGVEQDGPTIEELRQYVGSYDGRDFGIEGSVLTYFRQGMQDSIDLVLIGEDHFDIVIPPGAQVQSSNGHEIPTFKFERSDNGVVTTLVILSPDGSEIGRYEKRVASVE